MTALFSALALPSELMSAPAIVEFNRDIRPIFSDKCFTCHGPDKANRVTELRFDTEAGAKITLGEGRQSIVAGDPDKSELFRRIASSDEAVRMPPAAMGHAKLSEVEIDLIRRWIEQGAKRGTGHSSTEAP
jgi:mono/diheme cytochrome c family protein